MTKVVSKHFVHLVWATRTRALLLCEDDDPFVEKIIAGQCVRLGCVPIAIGVNDDHVHVLCGFGRDVTIAELVRSAKSASATLFNRRHINRVLAWQQGYAHISVSPEPVTHVTDYVREQRTRHRRNDTVGWLEDFETD